MRARRAVALGERGYLVTRNEDIAALLTNPEVFSSGTATTQTGTKRPLIPLQIDPPRHRDYRRILDTVSASLDCMMLHLALHPDKRLAIVRDPSIIPNAVEELLRWESPVMMVARFATQDTVIAGCPVREGQVVTALLGAANTDGDVVNDPDTVRFDRDANRHIAFGRGIHRCLGSHLARLELRIALREWHARIPDYAVAAGFEPAFTTSIRSLEALPLAIPRS